MPDGFSVQPNKTSMVLFTRKRTQEPFRRPMLCGITLETSDSMKFLGIILDRKLTFIQNAEQRCRMANTVFWQCRRTYGASWGLKPSVVLWFINPSCSQSQLNVVMSGGISPLGALSERFSISYRVWPVRILPAQ